MGFGIIHGLGGGQAAHTQWRKSWVRSGLRPPLPADGKWTGTSSALFLVYSDNEKVIDTKACLISTSANAIVVKNRTIGTQSTVVNGIDVVEGWNWIEILDTSASWTIVPFDADSATETEITACELYATSTSASWRPQLPSGAFPTVTASVLEVNRSLRNTIDYFVFSGIKTSWNYIFSGLRGLKKIEIDCTTATVTFNNAALACEDLSDIVIHAASLNLSNLAKFCNLANLIVTGTVTNPACANYSTVANLSMAGVSISASTTAFTGTKIRNFSSESWNAGSYAMTISVTLGLFNTEAKAALRVAQKITVSTKNITLGLANYDEDVVQALLSAGWNVSL
jgi:hypothetical protein